MIERYAGTAPSGDVNLIRTLASVMRGRSFLHVNSTRSGGGVAEILQRLVPMLESLGIDARWEVLEGDAKFFDITKKIHNALQGNQERITDSMWGHHLEVNRENAKKISLEADCVMVHDPQPAPLVNFRSKGHWLWRCHIDMSNPVKEVCDRLKGFCEKYDASVFSIARFTRSMAIDEFIIQPSIDPLSEKNRDLAAEEIKEVLRRFNIPEDRPMLLQVSRYDRFKDPLGVISAYRYVKRFNDCTLVLAGSLATDDPEGEAVLKEVEEAAAGDPDIFVLMLPPQSDREINALQRAATVVLQKSLREGFGLTVSEAMWKGKPVIGGAAGGIPAQVVHGVTGFLVHSPEGAAFRTRQFLNNPGMAERMGMAAKERVRTNFLITREARDYLSLWHMMENRGKKIIEL